jgi:coproporphyrinogen III oxidase
MTDDELKRMFLDIQDHICDFVVDAEGALYHEDLWDYDKGEGGGRTRVWEAGNVLEKGGVNFSAIQGTSLPESAATAFKIPADTAYTAMGVSLVLHPWNPFIPTIHMNVRYFSAGDVWWFGGGVDLTPYYPVKDEVIAFHCMLRDLCERHQESYLTHKATCDDYFTIIHRGEMRGVGGIFFDHLNTDKSRNAAFVNDLGKTFTELYRPFVQNHRDAPYENRHREFQLVRRARYAEFNLVYDRGTKFGLQSNGRIESILMSMPRLAAWHYNWQAEPNSPEEELITYYLQPQDWVGMAAGAERS